MAFDIQFKLIYQGIRDVFRVRSLSKKHPEYIVKDGSTGQLKLKNSLAKCGSIDVRNEVIYIRQNAPNIFVES